MVGILITGHGHLATGFATALKLITGITENVVYVDFDANHSMDILKENLQKAMDSLEECDGILALVDLEGGSPFYGVCMCKTERPDQKIEIITGTNLSMVIEGASMMAAYDDPLELAEALIPTGKECIARFESEKQKDDLGVDLI